MEITFGRGLLGIRGEAKVNLPLESKSEVNWKKLRDDQQKVWDQALLDSEKKNAALAYDNHLIDFSNTQPRVPDTTLSTFSAYVEPSIEIVADSYPRNSHANHSNY